MTLLCTAPRCAVRDHHATGCDSECRGCLPAEAVTGEAFCAGCSTKLRRWLDEIPELFADVVDPPSVVDTRQAHQNVTTAAEDVGDPIGRPRDPVAALLPAGAVCGASRQPRVTGGADEALAVRYVEAGPGSVHVTGYPDDQIGDPPPAVVLDSWCRDWQHQRNQGELLPAPSVANLCRWLGDRLDWALARHGAIADFHDEIRGMHSRLWSEAGRVEPRPELCHGVPCRRCDLLSLWRKPDGTGDVECHNPDCRTVYRADEYTAWTRLVAASTKRLRQA